MSNLLRTNRELKDLQPKSTFDDKDLNNEEKDTKITKKKREKSVNMKISKSSRDFLVAMVMLSYAKNQKDAVNTLVAKFKESLTPAEAQLFDQQLAILKNKPTGRMLG
ncbi:DUF5388 domain-containing protein [Lactobacillus hominis]|uniref:DUF5388 domain-containing protein n=1 Tax=Lactobacillus hominis TaxID=1203033 RepID=UPI0024BAA101|nr:DUF5388 domain-containing protein [Lactobacillus hominis]